MKPKRPRDTNQLAKFIVGLATGTELEEDPNQGKDPAAVALGSRGGKARAAKLSQDQLSEIGKKAAAAKAAKRATRQPAEVSSSSSRSRPKKKARTRIEVPEG